LQYLRIELSINPGEWALVGTLPVVCDKLALKKAKKKGDHLKILLSRWSPLKKLSFFQLCKN